MTNLESDELISVDSDEKLVSHFDDCAHVVCCFDNNMSLCGLVYPGNETINPPGPSDCKPCDTLQKVDGYCPRGLNCADIWDLDGE